MRAIRQLLSFVACAVLVVAVFDGEAHAQQDRQRARQLYATGQALFDSGQYAAAEQSFRAAYAAVPNPTVLRAIAAAQEQQGNVAGAAATLQQYLRENPSATDRAEVEARVRQLSARPATVMIVSTPPGAAILIDGQDVRQTTPAEVQLPAGDHSVELRLTGYAPTQQRFTAQASTRVRLQIVLGQAGGTTPDVFGANGGDGRAATASSGGTSGPTDPSIGVWVTAGIGAAALISGTVFGFLALSEQSNFDAAPSNDTADRGEAFALVADISFGVAAAMALTAIVLYIVDANSAGSEQTADGGGPRLALSPWVDPRGAGGAALRLSF